MHVLKAKILTCLIGAVALSASGQVNIDNIINVSQTERIEKTLSSDEMKGRAVFTPSIDKAADFIAREFKSIGLETPDNSGSYLQEFTLLRSTFLSATALLDGHPQETKNIVAFTTNPHLVISQDSGYQKAYIRAGDNFFSSAFKYVRDDKDYLVLVDSSFSKEMHRMPSFKRPGFKQPHSVVFILTNTDPVSYQIEVKHDISKLRLANVVGILPGKSKANEYVIFSGHYDHLGIGKPDARMDSIYNGANDDASGTTAVIELASYFKQLDRNERTLVFVAFTAEETGGYGSQYFSRQYNPSKVMAMFNIEMIGTQSRWGTNSAYITGYEKTDMGAILEKNLQGSKFRFYPDPYTPQSLFYRSDNATLARLGVPAHTISTSKMEEPPHDEPNYHKPSDEIGTLDLTNMTEIIKAIAVSAGSIVEGRDTPTRVKTEELRK